MKVIKPNKISVLTRSFEHERKHALGVSVLLFVPLGEVVGESPDEDEVEVGAELGAGVEAEEEEKQRITREAARWPLLSEVSMWTFVADRMGKEAVLDGGIPKCRGEYLVHGRAYAPGGEAQAGVPVRATVDTLEKSLFVRGDRYWQSGRHASEPRPFVEMPLDWSLAYGGPGYARNPLGRGYGETELHGQRLQLLPNIELPDQQVGNARQQAEPGGFGPVDLSWPQRQELVGTYDQAWLEQLFPGCARDIDWGFFNIAPRDQQREDFWAGGERFRFDNLHPTRPVIEGELPRHHARAFVTRGVRRKRSDGIETAEALEAELEEVPLRLQTLWFFPDAEKAVMIFQGSVATTSDDASDIRYLLLAAEGPEPSERRPLSHYAEALAMRLDRKSGLYAALREHELLPPGQAELGDPMLEAGMALRASEDIMEANLLRRAEREHKKQVAKLVALGVPALLHPKPPAPLQPTPSLEELPRIVEKMLADAEVSKAEGMAQVEREREAADLRLAAAGIDPKELRAAQEQTKTGPPTFTAASQREAMLVAIAQCKAQGVDAKVFEDILADPDTQASWEEGESQLRIAYRVSAHFQQPAPRLDPARSAEARACVEQGIRAGEDFSTLNLTGADLSGMDLRGADLRGAFFESVCLDGADLTGADLSDAVLAHASLVGTTLDTCTLTATNLGKATLTRASLAGAQLRKTILHAADLSEASLRGAVLEGVDILEATLTGVDAREIVSSKLALIETPCTGIKLGGAKLDRCAFVKLDLAGADFGGADLSRCAFVTCVLAGLNFAGATLEKACFVESCVLDGAIFTEAKLGACNFRGSSMRGCELSKAVLDKADLSECQLSGSRFYQAVARETRFDKADLSDAVFLSANLMRASMMGATIYGADLRASNLYGADMARVRSNPAVQLDEANLTKVRIHPTHIEPEAGAPGAPS